jgi:SAM-dependent methyltransferase
MQSEEDALGTAMLDFQRGGLRGAARHRDGATTWSAAVEENYFGDHADWAPAVRERYATLDGPVLDVGCGAGQHALFFQTHHETVAFDVSPNAVRAARERGVEDARVLDMFELNDAFDPDRFASALVNGTQLGLGGSLAGVAALLADLARVTHEGATALVDSYDPARLDAGAFGGYRPDPREGVCRRTFHVEYERAAGGEGNGDDGDPTRERLVGPDLSFVLFSPERLRDACVGTPWCVASVARREEGAYYSATLSKA